MLFGIPRPAPLEIMYNIYMIPRTKLGSIVKHVCTLFLSVALSITPFGNSHSIAASLSNTAITMGSNKANATSTNHSISFTTATNSEVERIYIRYSTVSGGEVKPQHLNLLGSTLTNGTILGIGGWTLNVAQADQGLLYVYLPQATQINSGTIGTISINNITNSAIDDCEPSNVDLSDTCYVTVTTYSDEGSTIVDEGETTYTVTEDPSFALEVTGVNAHETHNGITGTVSTNSVRIPFGIIRRGEVKYAQQKLSIRTNAPHGYVIYARTENNIRGSYDEAELSPFAGINATWSTPQPWSSPIGSEANMDTGWVGANTTDTRVSGWSGNSSGKFGPLSTISHIVAQSSGPDRNGSTVYVSYALEVNAAQASDNYSGYIVYEVQARY